MIGEDHWTVGPGGHVHCGSEDRLAALRRVPFFAGLDEPSLAEVHALAGARGFEAGEPVVSAGSRTETLLVVASGTLKRSRPTPEGKDVALDLLGPGDVCGSLPVLVDTQ